MSIRPITPGAVEADIAQIISYQALHPHAIKYEVIFHTVDSDIPVDNLISIETSRDYANNVTDFILVSFMVGLGMYGKIIHPNMDNLEMTIVTKYYDRSYTDRYKMVIVNGPTNIAGTLYTSRTEAELNKMDMLLIETQCLSRLVESIRLNPTDGIYPYTNVSDVMKTVITNAIKDIKVEDQVVDTNINIVPPNNEKTYRHISIPTGVRVLDVPTYLQNTEYGVYGTDIGTYVQRVGYFEEGVEPIDTVFIYPLYNNKLSDEPGKRLMILSSPTILLANNENSYLIDGDVIKIIGSGDMTSTEISQSKLINAGNTIMYGNPNNASLNGVEVTNDTVNTSNASNITGERLKNKRDGNDGVMYTGASGNVYKSYSELSKNMLSHYQITWNFSNPQLLFPGMPVIYVYEDKQLGVIRLTGIIHSTFTKYNVSYKTHTTIVNVLLEPYTDGMEKSTDEVDVSY